MSRVVVVNGALAPEADVSAGRLLGLSCFETIAVRGGKTVQLEAHLARLRASAATLGLAPSGGEPLVESSILTALGAHGGRDGVLRLSLQARDAPVGLRVADGRADVLAVVTAPRYGDLAEGVAAVTSSVRAPDPEAWPSHVKAPCLPRYLAHRDALDQGAFEALMVNAARQVVSGSRSNLFAVLRDELVTPPAPPAFPGIVRERVLAAAAREGLRCRVAPIPLEALSGATEIFVTLTGPGLVPVVKLDGRRLGDGRPGPVARRLREGPR